MSGKRATTAKKRNRGIVASRVRLESAMLNAGIRTQAALASRIARDEGIVSPPRDTVNRAFRQERIATATLARIARALDVDPHSLYMTAEEADARPVPGGGRRDRSRIHPAGTANAWHPDGTAEKARAAAEPGALSFLIRSLDREARPLEKPVQALLGTRYRWLVADEAGGGQNRPAMDLARSYQADGVLTLTAARHGRFRLLRLFFYFRGVESLVWLGAVPEADAAGGKLRAPACVQASLSRSLAGLLRGRPDEVPMVGEEAVQCHEDCLEARNLLDGSPSELDVKRAQTLLDGALGMLPDFAHALAARAESHLAERWIGREKTLLDRAARDSHRAAELAPEDPYVNAVLARVLIHTGRTADAVRLLESQRQACPQSADLLCALAEALLSAHRQGIREPDDPLARAIAALEQACRLEPDYWRHWSDLGVARYTAGDVPGAIRSLETAAGLRPNELLLVNLGTLHFCLGDLGAARRFYEDALKAAPYSHLGYEFLGTLFYFTGDYPRSADYRKQALEKLRAEGGTYKMWGNLGDSFHRCGRLADAAAAYRKAIRITRRDELRGSLAMAGTIHRHYYRLSLAEIDPAEHAPAAREDYDFHQAMSQDHEPGTYLVLAEIELRRGHPENARLAFERSVDICPGLADHPTLNQLLDGTPAPSPNSPLNSR